MRIDSLKAIIQNHHRLLFYAGWILLAITQASYTELLDDEAYYWVYSRYLSWGYFDHPPMIAFLIKVGYSFFHNEFGVRCLAVVMNVFSVYFIEKLIDNKNQFLFYTIALSVAVFQLGGFFSVPDTPLLFFACLFFWVYQLFLTRPSWGHTFLVALVALLMLYSKYHAVLILFFTLLSNLSLLRQYKLYVVMLLIVTGFMPHLYWQYTHGWPSIQYHLHERNAPTYQLAYTTDYLLGQLLLPGPVAGFILLPAVFLYKRKTQLERALFFSMIGFYSFFLLSTYRGYVEANWTAPALISIIVLSHHFLQQHIKWRRLLVKLLPITLGLVVITRVAMIKDILPFDFIQSRFHAWSGWPQQVKQKTNGLPVVFNNSYQRGSKYWFYSGQLTYAPTYYRERRSNYDLWPIEDSLLGKSVYVLDIYNLANFTDSIPSGIGAVGFNYVPQYNSFAKVQFQCEEKDIRIKEGESFVLHCQAVAPAYYVQYILQKKLEPASVIIGLFTKRTWLKDILVTNDLRQVMQSSFLVTISPRLPKGDYYLLFSIAPPNGVSTHNSQRINFTID